MVNKYVITNCSTGYKTGQKKAEIRKKMDLFCES